MSLWDAGPRRRQGRGRRLRTVPGRFVVVSLAVLLGSAAAAADLIRPDRPGRDEGPAQSRPAVREDGAGGQGPHAAPSASAASEATCVARTLAGFSRDELAGQVVMAGVPADRPADGVRVVRREHLGGVFLAGRTGASPAVVRRGVDALQAAARRGGGVPLHVAVDQEGGRVQTLRGRGFGAIPAATEQGRWRSGMLAGRSRDWADALAGAGVTMNLAPVADTVPAGTERENPPIGANDRQYGDRPEAVAQDVATVVRSLQAAGVVATAKHFPGLGRVRVNTDSGRGAEDPRTTVTDPSLMPFRAAWRAGASAVMVSSARYPGLDDDTIAVFSRRVLTELLRERLGFRGVVVSDDLGAAVAVRDVAVGERAVRFVRAGGDLVLTVRAGDAGRMRSALAAEAGRSPEFATRLAAAAGRVIGSKVRQRLISCGSREP